MNQGSSETASASSGHPAAEDATPAFDWCVVEIFGHRRHAGRGREEEKFGNKMLRIDVPQLELVPSTMIATASPDGTVRPASARKVSGWETHWYPGSAIFSFTLTDEETVMRMNRPYEAASRYRLPAPTEDDDDLPFEHEDQDEAGPDPAPSNDSPIT